MKTSSQVNQSSANGKLFRDETYATQTQRTRRPRSARARRASAASWPGRAVVSGGTYAVTCRIGCV
jgi:hypothetical protein